MDNSLPSIIVLAIAFVLAIVTSVLLGRFVKEGSKVRSILSPILTVIIALSGFMLLATGIIYGSINLK